MDTNTNTNNEPAISIRDKIRTAVLDSKAEGEVVLVFGVQIEVRPPILGELMQYRDFQNDDTLLARAIVKNCYVPGTLEREFDDTDIEVINGRQFSSDLKRLNKAIQNALGDDSSIVAAIEDDTKSPEA